MAQLQRSLTGRILAAQSLTLTPTPRGLALQEGGRERLLDWSELRAPPLVEPGRFYARLYLESIPPRRLGWLPKKQLAPLAEESDRLWRQRQRLRLTALADLISRTLKQHYLAHSRWQRLVSHSREGISSGLAHLNPGELSPSHRNALKLVRRCAEAAPHTLNGLRHHYVQRQCRQYRALFDAIESAPLTNAQRTACVSLDDTNLVIGAAGTGKTSVLVSRIAYLLASGQAGADGILVLGHDSTDARRLRQTIDKRLGGRAEQVTVTHFRALALRLVHRDGGSVPRFSELATDSNAMATWLRAQVAALLKSAEGREMIISLILQEPELHRSPQLVSHYRQRVLAGLPLADRLRVWHRCGAFNRLLARLAHMLSAYRAHKLVPGCSPGAARAPWQPLLNSLYDAYTRHLRLEGCIDFQQLLAQATRRLRRIGGSLPWSQVLVDDFQLATRPHAALLQALQPHLQSLFVLGDDWQGIGRHQGSDLSLLTQFETHFGAHSRTVLDMTFRCNSNLNLLATAFIGRNPAQMTKTVTALKRSEYPAVTLVDRRLPLTELVKAVARRAKPGQRLTLLARCRPELPSDTELAALQRQIPDVPLSAATVKESRGSQSHWVILIGMGADNFPSRDRPLPALESLLPPVESFAFAEERRLFYLALTRAQEQIYLQIDKERPGPFAIEIQRLLDALNQAARR